MSCWGAAMKTVSAAKLLYPLLQSSSWHGTNCSCNVRSLMQFLLLRGHKCSMAQLSNTTTWQQHLMIVTAHLMVMSPRQATELDMLQLVIQVSGVSSLLVDGEHLDVDPV